MPRAPPPPFNKHVQGLCQRHRPNEALCLVLTALTVEGGASPCLHAHPTPNDTHVADGTGETITTSNTLEERAKAFDALIQGEYKDEFTKRTQKIIDRRFKQTKELESRVKASQPVMDLLAQRYGVSDPEGIMSALESDNAYWQDMADEAGMTVDQYREFQRLKRENEALQAEHDSQLEQMQIDQQAEKWFMESEALSMKYPNFDLEMELNNPQFISLLRSGVPMEHAFEVVHLDEIKQQNQLIAEKAVTDNLRAKGKRPLENGVSSQSATQIKKDVSKLTKKERAEIALKAQRGELVTF